MEVGTHDVLIDRKGAYYNLVKNQLEWGVKDMSTYNEMKKKAESDQDRIELRSEKVRNMIARCLLF